MAGQQFAKHAASLRFTQKSGTYCVRIYRVDPCIILDLDITIELRQPSPQEYQSGRL